MDVDEFFRRFKAIVSEERKKEGEHRHPRPGWRYVQLGDGSEWPPTTGIRRDPLTLCECPVTYLANRITGRASPFDVGDYIQAGEAIGLSRTDTRKIVRIADGNQPPSDDTLRRGMMEIIFP